MGATSHNASLTLHLSQQTSLPNLGRGYLRISYSAVLLQKNAISPTQVQGHSVSNSMPMRASACAGWAAKRRQAAAMLVWPAHLKSPMAVLRSAAITCGRLPPRTCERSASKVTSRPSATCSQSPNDTHQLQHSTRCRSLGAQTGDPIDHFDPLCSRFFSDDMPSHFEHLCQPRPIAVASQGPTCREVTGLDTPMAHVHRTHAFLAIARWRQGKN